MDKIARRLSEIHPLIMSEFHRINAGFSQVLAMPMNQFKIIMILASDGPCNLSDISKDLGIAPSWASETVDRLVKKSLVERKLSERDRRQIKLTLSKSGEKFLSEFNDFSAQYFVKMLEILDDERAKKKLLEGFETLYEIASLLKEKRNLVEL